MGKNNENRAYRMQGVILELVTQEKGLEVVVVVVVVWQLSCRGG